MNLNGVYYLHENGSLICKQHVEIEDLADSTFVKHWWYIRDLAKSPKDFLEFLKEAKAYGANESDIKRLVEHNNLVEFIPDCYHQLGM